MASEICYTDLFQTDKHVYSTFESIGAQTKWPPAYRRYFQISPVAKWDFLP